MYVPTRSAADTDRRRSWSRSDIGVERVEVPSACGLAVEPAQHLRVGRVTRQVGAFERIGREVVQLVRVGRAPHELHRATADHHDRGHGTFGHVLAHHVSLLVDSVAHADERTPGERIDEVVDIGTGQLGDRRQHVDQRHR